jgi:flagellar protein FliS
MSSKQINEYQNINNKIIEELNPYQTVGMLLKNAQDKIQAAINGIKNQDIETRGKNISVAILIIEALQSVLNLKEGGEVAANLFRLYQYMCETLLMANLHSSEQKLLEVYGLIESIKQGWDGISDEAQKQIRSGE